MSDSLRVLVDVHKHQFSLEDIDLPGTFDGWKNAWDIVNVGVAEGLLTVFTTRADGRVPLTVRCVDSAPDLDRTHWSSVVEASLRCASGVLAVRELAGDPRRSPTMAIGPVSHRALVCMGNVDSAGYDGSDGADHYLVVLWPGDDIVCCVARPMTQLVAPEMAQSLRGRAVPFRVPRAPMARRSGTPRATG